MTNVDIIHFSFSQSCEYLVYEVSWFSTFTLRLDFIKEKKVLIKITHETTMKKKNKLEKKRQIRVRIISYSGAKTFILRTISPSRI